MKAIWPDLELELDTTGYFSGEVHRGLFSSAPDGSGVAANFVQFGPRARTNWHAHAGDQILLVVMGAILVQTEGARAVRLEPGQSIRIADGLRHWHGSAGESSAHVAVNLGGTDWQQAVTELEYDASVKGAVAALSES